MTETGFLADLQLALKLADASDRVSLSRFQAQNLVVEAKPDSSPVTDADRAVEEAIREGLSVERPEDAIFGEEFGTSGTGSRQWVIDPIDGTANFLRGNPIWGTLIALTIDGDPVVGVASSPALGRRWWAARGHGAWMSNSLNRDSQPKRLRVSEVSNLQDSALSLPRLNGWIEAGFSEQALQLNSTIWRSVGGSDLWSYALVAEGVADATIEFGLQPYDIAALIPIVEEAGGNFTSLSGERGIHHGDVIVSNGKLHTELQQLFLRK